MNKKVAALVAVLALAGLITAAVMAYGWLRDRAEAPDILMALEQDDTAADLAEAGYPPETPPEDTTEAENSSDEAENAPEEDENYQAEYEEALPQAPDFAMQDMYGNEVRLSDFFGKPIVLNFWTTWCPSCVREMPYFEQLYQEMGGEIHVLKVNLLDGTRETRETVDRFRDGNDYTFPIYFDLGEGAIEYGVRHIPVTFFINADGYAVAQAQGAVDEDNLWRGLEMAGVDTQLR